MHTQRPFSDDFRPDIRQWLMWIPSALGIGLLLGILVTFGQLAFLPPPPGKESRLPEPVVAVLPSLTPVATSSSGAATGATASASPAPQTTDRLAEHDSGRTNGRGSGREVRPSPGPPVSPAPSHRPPKPEPTRSHPSRPETAPVTRLYRVVNAWDDGFIGEVLVVNDSDAPRDWTVVLRFPDNVDRLYTSWVEGAPQATLTRVGRNYVWHSGAPVGARSSVPLRFQFARHDGGNSPAICTADGTACD